MFSLDGGARYWLYSLPVDMRKSFNGLSGIVNNSMGAGLRRGDVYVFVNSGRNRMKLLRQEEGGLVIYSLRLDAGRMRVPSAAAGGALSSEVGFDDVAGMVRSALDSPYVRRMKMLAGGRPEP